MSYNYKKTYTPTIGYTKLCRMGECSCKRLEFGIIELNAGDTVTLHTEDKEYAFVFMSGHADVKVGDLDWKGVGGRQNVFDGPAHTVYVPRSSTVTFTGCDHVTIGVIDTPTDKDSAPQWKKPEEVKIMTLGTEPWKRDFHSLIDTETNADYLTVGESFVEPGNWAGFPGHKHDEDNMPAECIAEEIYYFLFDKEQGFGFQALYTADGDIDVAYRVKNNDLTEFPRGYHLTETAPGYKMYILWLMAGDIQGVHRTNDPEHEWVLQQ
ncbi:MAG: 5-deoxy-glucuronate isomerase [Oscillospiraceae bacterium]|nr:5-deoxy-glucuronate isomerase [Oscillospiraceae bacterium]